MILFQTLDIRCLVVYNITFLLLVFFTFESALYVAVAVLLGLTVFMRL